MMSVAVYAILIATLAAPDVQAKAVEAFGQKPLGLPAVVFAGMLQTLLYLPMPRAFYHLALIGEQARREGRLLLGLGTIPYIMSVDHRHPHLSRSQRICLGSLGYFIAIVAAWTAYAAALGI